PGSRSTPGTLRAPTRRAGSAPGTVGVGSLAAAWLKKLFGYVNLTRGGEGVPSQDTLEFVHGTLTDDPANGRTLYDPFGEDIDPEFGDIEASSLTIGDYGLKSHPAVTTVAGANANLLAAAVSVPSGKTVSIAYVVKGKIVVGTVFAELLIRGLVS